MSLPTLLGSGGCGAVVVGSPTSECLTCDSCNYHASWNSRFRRKDMCHCCTWLAGHTVLEICCYGNVKHCIVWWKQSQKSLWAWAHLVTQRPTTTATCPFLPHKLGKLTLESHDIHSDLLDSGGAELSVNYLLSSNIDIRTNTLLCLSNFASIKE